MVNLLRGSTIYAMCTKIIDGDTIEVKTIVKKQAYLLRIRLHGIDAPEMSRKNVNKDERVAERVRAIASRDYLTKLVYDEELIISFANLSSIQSYERYVGTVYKGEIDICQKMLEVGHAKVY